MAKNFDVVIGNPPYHAEAQGGGNRDTPIYHLFMDAAYEVGEKVVLITPARFLFNAGFTPKAWNAKMLADPHLTVPIYVPNSDALFPGTDIKGGIAVTYRDKDQDCEPIGTFTKYPELNQILHKVAETGYASISGQVSSGRAYAYTQAMHDSYPRAAALMSGDAQYRVSTNAFEQLDFLFHRNHPNDGLQYIRVLGLAGRAREHRWIRNDFLTGPDNLGKYKVVVAKANGSGVFGETLSTPLVAEPGVGVTMTFITIGGFDGQGPADACLKYIKSKFARALLGVLKTTQDNPARVWKYVPLQDFTPGSDIDWVKSIPQVDQQLYAKYGLDDEEISFIEAKVKPMQ